MNSKQAAQRQLSAVRRAAAENSFRTFCLTYLPGYFRSEPSPMHVELFTLLERATEARGARIAVAAPRGHAKTSIVSTAYILWCICYGREPYIVMVSNTADQAKDLLSHIKRELEGNTRLIDDFPEVCETAARSGPPRWRKDEIITKNEVKVTAIGVGGSIRGRKHRQHRPTLIVLDDIENETDVRSPDQRAHIAEWFNKAIAKLGAATTNIIVVGTILHYDALLPTLVDPTKSPGWHGLKYRAVISWAERQDLWQTWEGVYTHLVEYEGESGPAVAERFFMAHQADMLLGTQVLWPQHESYKALMEIRIRDGRASFDCEKQNEPTNPEDCLFRESDLVFWDDQFKSEQELISAVGAGGVMYGACDPSLGKQGARHDDTAIIAVLRDSQTGIHYVLDADIRKRKPDEILDAVIRYHGIRKFQRFGFETNQFQDFLADELIKRSRASVQVPVTKLQHTTDKVLRIQTLQPLVSAGTIRFCRRHSVLLEQLRQFPHGAHDDGPDALEMAVDAAKTPEVGAGVIFMGKNRNDLWRPLFGLGGFRDEYSRSGGWW